MSQKQYGRNKYSLQEKRAYWIGVGISAARHGDADVLLNSSNSDVRNSARSGYEADNRRDLSTKIAKGNSRR